MVEVRSVLCLGGSGFVGRPAVQQLVAAGIETHLVGRSDPGVPGIIFHSLDILPCPDLGPLMRSVNPSHLLHFAWVTEPGAYWTSPENLDWVAASLRLVRAFAESGGRRVVVAGTCAEYEWKDDVLDERMTPLAPATPYGQAKASLFQTLDKFAAHMGLSFAWGRIFFPFGPGEKSGKLLSETITGLRAGRSVDFTDGLQSWDFMHVDDVARAFVSLLLSDVQGPVNIASGTARSVRSVVEDFADRLSGRALLNFGARPRGASEVACIAASVSRLFDEVGFRPLLTWDEAVTAAAAEWMPPAP